MGRINDERRIAEEYMISKGWAKTQGVISAWVDPISKDIFWFNTAWDLQYERDKNNDKR